MGDVIEEIDEFFDIGYGFFLIGVIMLLYSIVVIMSIVMDVVYSVYSVFF